MPVPPSDVVDVPTIRVTVRLPLATGAHGGRSSVPRVVTRRPTS